ncbi:hypothetical protein [Natronobiforma cellulositropha]|uniref:hypothetical protein n=1 Tax=Natronobiforma cellulositropha TaxID=1679076 RepID=UPI0021D604A8|nr:hypothetical protein [Natronobiforma cellulositropha]
MDVTQVGLGLVLVGSGVAALASPSLVDSSLVVTALALATVTLAGGVLLVTAARERQKQRQGG